MVYGLWLSCEVLGVDRHHRDRVRLLPPGGEPRGLAVPEEGPQVDQHGHHRALSPGQHQHDHHVELSMRLRVIHREEPY